MCIRDSPRAARRLELRLGTGGVLEPHLVFAPVRVGVPEPRRLGRRVVIDLRPVLGRQPERLQPGQCGAVAVHPVVAVKRHAEHDAFRRDLGFGVVQHFPDPGDRRDGAGRRGGPVEVVAHQPDLVGGPADRGVILRHVAFVVPGVRGLREHRHRQRLTFLVQGLAQFRDEGGEHLPVAGAQVLVVDIDARVVLALDQLDDLLHVVVPLDRVVQHPGYRLVLPFSVRDVGQ